MTKINFLLLIFLLIQCRSQHTTLNRTSKNTSISTAKEDELNAQFYFYKNSDTTVMFYSSFNSAPLLFTRLDTGLQFYASVKISIYFYSITKNILSDSASQIFHIPQQHSNIFQSFSFPLKNDNYTVKIFMIDQNRKVQYNYVTELSLTTSSTRNNFLVTFQNNILFKHYAPKNNTIKIYHRQKLPLLYVDVFKYHHQPALPPFSNSSPALNYLPDSSFSISLINNDYYAILLKPGCFYHTRTNQQSLEGVTVFTLDSVFPNIKDSKEMLYTSRYIMNKNEYERCVHLSTLEDTKKCIDNFWIQIAGSKERAKEILKNYYQRVIEANRLFTSHKLGWQTDRGMVYIIFGPPENIEKTFNNEKWFYSANGQKNALVFTFIKNKNNPFTSSDYILERSDYYKDIWYLTVDKIRQGRLSTK